MSRSFWLAYAALSALAILFLASLPFDPALELLLSPVRRNDTITSVERTDLDLCWAWAGDKLRTPLFRVPDVFLDHANGDVNYPEVFDRKTKKPWHALGVQQVGHNTVANCIRLPPDVVAGEPLRLRQVLHYRGFGGLWDLRVPLPDVVSPGTPP